MKARRLGDSVLWSAALQALRDHFPQAEIHLLLPAAYTSLYEGDSRFQAVLAVERELPRRDYDLFLGFHASRRSQTLARRSGARTKVLHHHDRQGRRFGSDLPVPHAGRPMSAMERDLNVVRALGFRGPSPVSRLQLTTAAREVAQKSLRDLGWNGQAPLVFLHPGASRDSKRWGLERYRQVLDGLPAAAFPVVITESAREWERDRYLWQRIQEKARPLCTSSLPHLAACLERGTVFVGSDSGIKHLACAVDLPTVTLFGPESIGEWHGYSRERHPAIQKPVLCRTRDPELPAFAWCGYDRCPLSSHACLSQITPAEVLASLRPFLPGE